MKTRPNSCDIVMIPNKKSTRGSLIPIYYESSDLPTENVHQVVLKSNQKQIVTDESPMFSLSAFPASSATRETGLCPELTLDCVRPSGHCKTENRRPIEH